MSHLPSKPSRHPSPASPFVFDVGTLGSQPGSARSESRIASAPADLHVALAAVPLGADVKLTLRLEYVMEGVLVTAEAVVPVAGECARCLEPVATSVDVAFCELYEEGTSRPLPDEETDDDWDRRFLDGNLLDLEPALRDAVVLALPLAPLCRPDCPGLCAECGVRLADTGGVHDHDVPPDPRWARLIEIQQPGIEEHPSGHDHGARAEEG
jgi:uncharacterized protein